MIQKSKSVAIFSMEHGLMEVKELTVLLWKQVKRSLDKYKKAFISEGCEILHQVRATESDLKNTEITNPYHYRYLYIVKVKR